MYVIDKKEGKMGFDFLGGWMRTGGWVGGWVGKWERSPRWKSVRSPWVGDSWRGILLAE